MTGTKQVAQTINNAHEWFADLMEEKGVDRDTAYAAIPVLVKHKLMKREPCLGCFTLKTHLAVDPAVVRRAAAAA